MITSYSELLTTIADWTKRSDMTARIPLFVSMGESAMNARLRLRLMESTETLSLTAGATWVALPAQFLEPISLVFSDSAEPLIQADRATIDGSYGKSGRPTYYAISSAVDFDCASDGSYSLVMRYFKRLRLSTDLNNAVLDSAPFAYLYGALQAYARWIEDTEQLAQYTALFQEELRQLEENDHGSRGLPALRTELPAVLGLTGFDITTG